MSTSQSDSYEDQLRLYLSERNRSIDDYKSQFDDLKNHIEDHIDEFFMFLVSNHSLEELYFGKIISSDIFKKNSQQSVFSDFVSDHEIPQTIATIDSEAILLYTRYSVTRIPENLELPSLTRVLNQDYDGLHPFFLIPNQHFQIWTDPNTYLSHSTDSVKITEPLDCYLAAGKENIETIMDKRFDGSGKLGYFLLSQMYNEAQDN